MVSRKFAMGEETVERWSVIAIDRFARDLRASFEPGECVVELDPITADRDDVRARRYQPRHGRSPDVNVRRKGVRAHKAIPHRMLSTIFDHG
jgi:hypothetical protein